MAAIFAKQGCPAAREADGQEIGSPRAGNSVVLTLSAVSANSALPKDTTAATAQYTAVVLSTTVACWIIFGTAGGDTAVANTAPAFLLNPNSPMTIGVPIGATNIAAVAGGAGFLSVLGIF